MRPQLRLNKVSELIHNSTHHQDVPMARVSVHFIEIIDKVRRRCLASAAWLSLRLGMPVLTGGPIGWQACMSNKLCS